MYVLLVTSQLFHVCSIWPEISEPKFRFRTCKVAGSEPVPNLQSCRFGTSSKKGKLTDELVINKDRKVREDPCELFQQH